MTHSGSWGPKDGRVPRLVRECEHAKVQVQFCVTTNEVDIWICGGEGYVRWGPWALRSGIVHEGRKGQQEKLCTHRPHRSYVAGQFNQNE